ncbi:MAG: T9SS type A sorting domain-containing protein [Flavobacteriaceae bacterium]|jgi:hypothetical protein
METIPVDNLLHIKTPYLEDIQLQLISLTGKLITSEIKSNHNGLIDLQINNLASGIYILKAYSENNTILFQKKIVK